ncbi:MAG: hypothetical protein ACRDIC_14400, partial [bacterium]
MAREAVGTIRHPQEGGAARAAEQQVRTPVQLAWRQLRKHRMALIGGAVLIVLYTLALFAEFIAPYTLDYADRNKFFHPPVVPQFY